MRQFSVVCFTIVRHLNVIRLSPSACRIDIKIFNNNADQGDSKLYFLQIAPTPRECCEDSSVPEFCLGLCSPADASARQENRITFCSKYDTIIEKCFQSAKGKSQEEQQLLIFYRI